MKRSSLGTSSWRCGHPEDGRSRAAGQHTCAGRHQGMLLNRCYRLLWLGCCMVSPCMSLRTTQSDDEKSLHNYFKQTCLNARSVKTALLVIAANDRLLDDSAMLARLPALLNWTGVGGVHVFVCELFLVLMVFVLPMWSVLHQWGWWWCWSLPWSLWCFVWWQLC